MSEVTRAEQLADKLVNGPCASWGEHANDLADAAAELRRLSAVEARQSELLQQAKEALDRTSHLLSATALVITHAESRAHAIKTANRAKEVLSAINEGGKSK